MIAVSITAVIAAKFGKPLSPLYVQRQARVRLQLSRAAMGLLALSAAGCATADHSISASNAAQAGSWRDQVGNQSVPLPGPGW